MSDIYLFDVDGTLTDAKCKIENSFADEFEAWMDNKEVYIVSGGSFERIIDQLGMNIMSKVEGVFACMGNIFYSKIEHINPPKYEEWEIVYENKFKAPRGLYKDLIKLVDITRSALGWLIFPSWEETLTLPLVTNIQVMMRSLAREPELLKS